MATDNTQIANRALRLVKAGRITALDDGSKNANVVNDIFTEVRAECLRQHTWKFATKFVTMARSSSTPVLGYDYAYVLPNDWIRTVSLHDNNSGVGAIEYEEGEIAGVGVLFASIETAYLRYVYEVTDPNRMAADFRTAFAYALAVQMPGISNISAAGWDRLEREAKSKMTRAKSADGQSGPPKQRPAGSWATSRQSWPIDRWPR